MTYYQITERQKKQTGYYKIETGEVIPIYS